MTQVNDIDLDIAKQVLEEMRKKEMEMEDDDPYTAKAREIEEKRLEEERQKRVKRAAKVQEVVDKIDENSGNIKFWSKKIIALVAFSILMVMAYNNGAFDKENWTHD